MAEGNMSMEFSNVHCSVQCNVFCTTSLKKKCFLDHWKEMNSEIVDFRIVVQTGYIWKDNVWLFLHSWHFKEEGKYDTLCGLV